MADWRVCKRAGMWRVVVRGAWADSYDTIQEAYSWALRGAVTDELYAPDGIARLNELLDAADWWAAYEKTCQEVSA